MELQMEMGLVDRIAEGPAWIYWWTRIIDTTNWLLVPLAFTDRRAHWALTAWFANIIIILTLFGTFGYVRLLGLSHILVWTPLLIYLWRERKPFSEESLAGKYLYWFMFVALASLIFDYIDLVRYMLGDVAA